MQSQRRLMPFLRNSFTFDISHASFFLFRKGEIFNLKQQIHGGVEFYLFSAVLNTCRDNVCGYCVSALVG